MKDDIVSKLDKELHKEITSEPQVVYILVQVRKLIETDNPMEDFEALKLHCSWVLHPKLSRASAKDLLGKLNDQYARLLGNSSPQEAVKELGERLGLKPFQAEFRKFLRFYGIDGSYCDGNWWLGFLYHYSRVVQDCPLECVAESGWQFNKVVLVDPDDTVAADRLYMQWEFLFNGQQIGIWIINSGRDSLEEDTPSAVKLARDFLASAPPG